MKGKRNIYTIGHSTRPLAEFLAMLQSCNIELLVDIRSLPGSRKYPHFDKDQLALSMPGNNIQYVHLASLGGRRRAHKDTRNTAWRHPAFRGYADYMETEAFLSGVKELENLGAQKITAYMCSEAVWWRCHRAMVSDYLKCENWDVWHIMNVGKLQEHPFTAPARIVDGKLSYTTGQ